MLVVPGEPLLLLLLLLQNCCCRATALPQPLLLGRGRLPPWWRGSNWHAAAARRLQFFLEELARCVLE